jgi:DnaD/phage-associated family protein
MNYIQEIRAFYDWLLTNPIPADAQALWHALMHINNKCGWQERFTVANTTLLSMLGFSRPQLDRMRNLLIQVGRIEYEKRKGRQAGIYRIIPFVSHNVMQRKFVTHNETQTETQPFVAHYETQPEIQVEIQPETQPETQSGHNQSTLNKLNINKTDLLNKDDDVINNKNFVAHYETQPDIQPDTQLEAQNNEDPLVFYQHNIGPLLPSIVDLVNEYRKELPDELITEAFKLAVKNNVRSMRYAEKIMLSWLDKGIRTTEDYKRHEAEWKHRKAAEAGREEDPTKRQYTQAEIEAAARYIKRAISRYEGSNVLEFIYSLGYPQEVADGAVKLLCERKELVV